MKWKKICCACLAAITLWALPFPILAQVPLSKEVVTETLAGKIRLLRARMHQLQVSNAQFLKVSDQVLEAHKKHSDLTREQATKLLEAMGLERPATIVDELEELVDDPHLGKYIKQLVALEKQSKHHDVDAFFQNLEREIRADLEHAKELEVDIAAYRNDLSDYARSRVESLMWHSIFMR